MTERILCNSYAQLYKDCIRIASWITKHDNTLISYDLNNLNVPVHYAHLQCKLIYPFSSIHLVINVSCMSEDHFVLFLNAIDSLYESMEILSIPFEICKKLGLQLIKLLKQSITTCVHCV